MRDAAAAVDDPADCIAAFQAFVAQALALVATSSDAPPEPAEIAPTPETMARFERFLGEARPLATQVARDYLAWFRPHARRLQRLRVADDLIDVAGRSRAETSYTRLLGWALGKRAAASAPGTDELSWAVQRALLRRICPGVRVETPFRVSVEFSTANDGVPDLVLLNADFVLVIEAKTVTREHQAAKTKKPQTEAYLPAVRRTLAVAEEVQGHTLLLSINGDRPRAAEARALTYVELAFAMLEAVDADAPGDTTYPYRAIASHWLEHARHDGDLMKVVDLAARDRNDGEILDALKHILALEQVFPMARS
jgi:hypothetical protein